ncbi:MAG: hypothetical protein LUE21_03185 [Oscillospiraceae bacterium]|nr:hypothetical protein [Oscillospiraceae bacterium]
MKKWKSLLALMLVFAMCMSMTAIGAFASDEASGEAETTAEASGEAEADASDETSSASGETSTATAASIEMYIGDQPILESHVYTLEADADEAVFTVKGYYVYDSSIAPTDSYYDTDDYVGIEAYDPADIQAVAVEAYDGSETAVTGAVEAGEGTDLTLALTGVGAQEDNAAYSVAFVLADGTVTQATTVYVITYENSQYETSQTLTLDGLDEYSLDLTEYALLQNTAQQYGGSQGLFDADDFEDTADLSEEEKELVTWYLGSAVTNGGDDWFTFGYEEDYLRLEAIHFIYKYFTIEAANGVLGFTGDANPVGGGTTEYKFFSANTTNLHAFIYDGTSFFGSIGDGSYTAGGLAIITDGIDREATLLDGYAAVTGQDLLVMIYNALVSGYASLSEDGLALQAQLIEDAAITEEDIENARTAIASYADVFFGEGENIDTSLITEPNLAAVLYTTADEKVAELEKYGITADNLDELTKGEAIAILAQLDGLQTYRSEFDNDSISGSPKDDLVGFFWDDENWSTITLEDGTAVYDADAQDEAGTVTEETAAITIENGIWYSEPTTGDSDDAYAGEPADTALFIDGGVTVTLIDSLVVPAGNVRSDSEYKFGVGGGIVALGEGTVVKILNTTGGLNVIGAGSYSNTVNMAGAVFSGMGAVVFYDNAQIFSYSQHPSNTCYSGAIIYHDSYMTGNSGRIFSTDFFGGYVIVDSTVYDKSSINMYLDETSTLLCVDSFLPGLSGANTGISQAYYQNCLVYNATSMFGFSNNTSMLDDVATGTVVNSDIHFASGSNTIATVAREQKAYVTLVDSTFDMEEYAGGYIFQVTGDEWLTASSLMVVLENTDLPAEDVFVGGAHTYETTAMTTVSTGETETVETDGTTLYVKADADSTVTLRQNQNDTYTQQFYSYKSESYTVENTGTIYVYDNDTEEWIATGMTVLGDGEAELENASYAELSYEDGVYTATYTIGTVTVILEYTEA